MHLDWTDSFFLFSSASVLATSLCRTDQARLESKKKSVSSSLDVGRPGVQWAWLGPIDDAGTEERVRRGLGCFL
jgi:hypothetical protein